MNIDLALCCAEPRLTAARQAVHNAESAGTAPVALRVMREELRYLEDSARVRVRRVLAALNDHDTEAQVSPETPAPALLPRDMTRTLQRCCLTEGVATAIAAEISETEANRLLDSIQNL